LNLPFVTLGVALVFFLGGWLGSEGEGEDLRFFEPVLPSQNHEWMCHYRQAPNLLSSATLPLVEPFFKLPPDRTSLQLSISTLIRRVAHRIGGGQQTDVITHSTAQYRFITILASDDANVSPKWARAEDLHVFR
jgi:hypothetical protein